MDKNIKPYFLCPAVWATKHGNICRFNLEQCNFETKEDLQKCPKLQKYILRL